MVTHRYLDISQFYDFPLLVAIQFHSFFMTRVAPIKSNISANKGRLKPLWILFTGTFGNPNAIGSLNNGGGIKLESHPVGPAGSGPTAAPGSNPGGVAGYYTCASYGSPSPNANEHQQSLLTTSVYSKQRNILIIA